MKRSVILGLSLIAVCLAAAWSLVVQHRPHAALNPQSDPALAQVSGSLETQSLSRNPNPVGPSVAGTASIPASSEQIEFRGQVGQLAERTQELAGVRAENEAYWARVAARYKAERANLPPPEFICKSEAQWAGTGSPENTFQSALWALHQRRLDAFLQLLEPETAKKLQAQIGDSPDTFLDEAAKIPAMRLSDLQYFGAATRKARLEFGPDDQASRTIFFFLLDGQWKMVLENPDARFTP